MERKNENGETLDIWAALGYLERIESSLAELYAWFAGLFADDQEVAALFRRLSLEEQSHLNIVQFEIRMVMRERKAFGDISIDLRKIKKAISMIETIRVLNPPPTVEEALEYTIELETYSCDGHYRDVITQANPAIGAMVGNITTADEVTVTRSRASPCGGAWSSPRRNKRFEAGPPLEMPLT